MSAVSGGVGRSRHDLLLGNPGPMRLDATAWMPGIGCLLTAFTGTYLIAVTSCLGFLAPVFTKLAPAGARLR
jgi:hypothetical protein